MSVRIQTVRDELRAISVIDEIIHQNNVERGSAIPILQAIQNRFGYVAPAFLEHIAEATGTTASDLYSIATFYSQFRMEPLGEHVVRICHGTACHLAGADLIAQAFATETGAAEGRTSSDGKFTVERVACLGCCSLAPVVMIDDETHGRMTPELVRKVVKHLRQSSADRPAAAVTN